MLPWLAVPASPCRFYKIVRIAMGGDSKPAKKAAPAAVKAD
jgi:hypothetical protein